MNRSFSNFFPLSFLVHIFKQFLYPRFRIKRPFCIIRFHFNVTTNNLSKCFCLSRYSVLGFLQNFSHRFPNLQSTHPCLFFPSSQNFPPNLLCPYSYFEYHLVIITRKQLAALWPL